MRILTVTPIKRGIAKDTLSYYTMLPVLPGALVSVPLRKKHIPALVLSAEPVADAKSLLKTQGFQLKKIKNVIAENFFTESFMRAAEKTAEYCASSTGAIFAALVPAAIFEDDSRGSDISASKESEEAYGSKAAQDPKKSRGTISEKNVLQASLAERLSAYKKIIREEFAAGRSVFCIAPTIEETRFLHETLKKGIEDYAFLFNGSLKKKTLVEEWRNAASRKHPVLIVSTGSFLSIPREDTGAIIIEHENSRSYKTQSRPYIDIRNFAETFARLLNARLILGDSLLRTETLYRESEAELIPLEPLIFRSPTGAEQALIDMRKKPDAPDEKFQAVSKEMKALVARTKERSERMFIYASRKGYAPTTLCRDCGEIVTCKNCKSPVALHISEKEGGNRFVCHRCGLSRNAKEVCVRCGSWRLMEYGAGIERIEAELREMDPELPIFVLDKDSASTEAEARRIAGEFMRSEGSILIGTELALHHLELVDRGAVSSVDHLFSLPDFRIGEKIFALLLAARNISRQDFLIETRRPDEKIFKHVLDGDLGSFYREDLAERQHYGYPPFAILIKISVTADEARAKKEIEQAEKLFEGEESYSFPAFVPNVRGKYTMHLLLKLKPKAWPEAKALAKLRSLPPYFSIRVDPENLL